MLGCNNIIGNDQFINLQYVVLSQYNTKLAVLFDFDKNYTHKNGDTPTRSKVAVYEIQKGKITEFTANNETKPFFSCDGTIIVVGAPVPYNANPPVARSFGVLICDLIGATKENKAVPSHHFKRQRFLNVHFVTSDFVWCDQVNTTSNPNGQRHTGFQLRRNRNGRVVRSAFKQDEARISFSDEHSWVGNTHSIQIRGIL